MPSLSSLAELAVHTALSPKAGSSVTVVFILRLTVGAAAAPEVFRAATIKWMGIRAVMLRPVAERRSTAVALVVVASAVLPPLRVTAPLPDAA